ncbi:hypothetical protein [Novosphingobium mangrovi (ex Huang et al. 2023)]|uniref:Ferric reductase like transmembrane component n=1 Tax=Novosphingobium mangrovi (ex Huang et al. 2023) TaxID=2976432 RepID=A0ABT2I9S3_9SPHN|nr:hypothetical protein [Novosphingobium mangrovi (ex Huang et al. 2023)]MCT2401541.1 hypothetical protein [Novosphingobium mangrovi (ex Huang et al. 2023)]
MASVSDTGPVAGREYRSDHEGFLRHRRFRWMKIATGLCVVAIAAYFLTDPQPRPGGGTWIGYTLGTIGALLIVWLSLLGIRKRAITEGRWSLKAWTSAHVYLGLSLIVVATLHTGFQFGWNVHTLAYALMMLVILSGLFGIWAYASLPAALSSNREQMTQGQMVDGIRALDRQLHEAAQPLGRAQSDLVIAALEEDPFGYGLWRRLSGHYPHCATQAAIEGLARANEGDAAVERVEKLLVRRKAQLERLRRHMRLKALLEVWLYVHVPATMALLAALTAHIISVFYYW